LLIVCRKYHRLLDCLVSSENNDNSRNLSSCSNILAEHAARANSWHSERWVSRCFQFSEAFYILFSFWFSSFSVQDWNWNTHELCSGAAAVHDAVTLVQDEAVKSLFAVGKEQLRRSMDTLQDLNSRIHEISQWTNREREELKQNVAQAQELLELKQRISRVLRVRLSTFWSKAPPKYYLHSPPFWISLASLYFFFSGDWETVGDFQGEFVYEKDEARGWDGPGFSREGTSAWGQGSISSIFIDSSFESMKFISDGRVPQVAWAPYGGNGESEWANCSPPECSSWDWNWHWKENASKRYGPVCQGTVNKVKEYWNRHRPSSLCHVNFSLIDELINSNCRRSLSLMLHYAFTFIATVHRHPGSNSRRTYSRNLKMSETWLKCWEWK